MNWAEEELSGISLGDARLDRRAGKLLASMSNRPQASIPQACGGAAEIKAAYRLIEREDVDWRDLMAPHWNKALQRMAGQAVVLCIQDTTELNFNGRQTQGLGRLSYDAQRGMYAHMTYAVTPHRVPLGVLDCWMWARRPRGEAALLESTRWIDGYERIAEMAAQLPSTRLVYVADREADFGALLGQAQVLGYPADLLIRVRYDRKLQADDAQLFAALSQAPVLGEIVFALAPGRGRKARTVTQSVSVVRSVVRLPGNQTTTLTVVQAMEHDAPQGDKPVCWRLLTNRSVNDLAQASELIDWYRARWEVELYFHIVKTGCRVEQLQLETIERVERALALYLMVAWRIHYLMRLGRDYPDLDCEMMFDTDEWKAAYLLAKKKPPATPPTLNEVMRMVASAGGFMGRKGDGQPGAKAIWSGMQALHFFVEGMRAALDVAAGNSYG
jgi:IS4 transposase